MELKVRTGIVTGREHLVYGINCQDSLFAKTFEHEGYTYHIGVVSDGCGEGERSETGAHLATSFLIYKMEKLVRDGYSIKFILRKLYFELLRFLKKILTAYDLKHLPAEEVDVIKNHFLFTVIGFIIGPDDTVIFAVGDGVVLINDFLDVRDQKNTPTYPTYHLVSSKYLKSDRTYIPKEFDVYDVKTENMQKLAVGTDSWQYELDSLFLLFNEEQKTTPQRLMNVLSQKEKRFKDDAAIITVTKTE